MKNHSIHLLRIRLVSLIKDFMLIYIFVGVKVVSKKAPTAVKILTSSNFGEEVLKSGKATLVEFYAPWVSFFFHLIQF